MANISFENVLNVVNPPHTPVISSRLAFCEITPPRSARPARTPINRHPSIFTANVPIGNGNTVQEEVMRLTAYRPQVPIKPPAPAIIISFNIFSCTDY